MSQGNYTTLLAHLSAMADRFGSILCWCQSTPVAYTYIRGQISPLAQDVVGEFPASKLPTDFATESNLVDNPQRT